MPFTRLGARRRPTSLGRAGAGWLCRLALVATVAATSGGGRARGQAEVRNATQPLLTLDTGGHSAPVTALVFAGGGEQLLSAGWDKVVHVWDLGGDGPALARTIRPPVWRGPRGVIFALALAPEPDAGGQRVLAVAGFGVQSTYGNIALYRYPGRAGSTTGDVLAQLPAGSEADPEPPGHWNSVLCLAFDPTGRYLASGSFDRTVRLWDVAARRTVAVFRAHAGAVKALAYSPDGTRLATAGDDGVVRLWAVDPARLAEFDRQRRQAPDLPARRRLDDDFNRRALVFEARPHPRDPLPGDPRGVAVNALAYSPDGRWVVIGRENGRLIRYAAANLGDERWLPVGPRQGAVEALAFDRAGGRLATAIVARRLGAPSERPDVTCDVEVRRMPDGVVVGPRLTRSNLVYAVAFSPDGRRLACAGGDDQGVWLVDLNNPGRPPVTLAGQGWSVWDVGFTRDSRSVGFARERADGPAPPARYWGFDLRARAFTGFDRADLARARPTLDDGSSIRPVSPLALEVVDAQGRPRRIDLDPTTEGRWWSYTFVPPGPGHDRPAVAVGAVAGVVVFALDPGQQAYARTRVLAGHAGAVYAVAPSPDGRWLASGSSDQTVRLWALDGCDRVPAFGARFERRPDGRWAAAAVEPRGYAEAMGLRAGDVVREVRVGGKPRDDTAAALAALDAAPPHARLEFVVARDGAAVELGATKRDSPALTLFPATDREWVLWTPRGYYDTSIAGDRRFLGWHRNGARAGGDEVDVEAPTDFFTIDKYEKELRRPDVLDALAATADVGRALALVPAPARDAPRLVRDESPPTVEIVEPAYTPGRPLVVQALALPVRARARTEPRAEGRRQVAGVRFLVDGEVQDLDRPGRAEVERRVELRLTPGVHRVSVAAVNDRDRERLEGFEVDCRPPAPAPVPAPPAPEPARPPRAPRLVVVAVGADRFEAGAPVAPIRFAAQDAKDVARFLCDPQAHGYGPTSPITLNGPDASSGKIRATLERLASDREGGAIGPGDTVVLMVESHVVTFERKPVVVASDTAAAVPPAPAVRAEEVTEVLATLARYGCRVMVLLDGVHEPPAAPGRWEDRVDEWVRDLTRQGVVAFVASINGPGRRATAFGHGAFAQAVINSGGVRSRPSLAAVGGPPRTLRAFREAVVQGVLDLTALRQAARCYVPATLTDRLTIFDPPTRPDPRGFEALNRR